MQIQTVWCWDLEYLISLPTLVCITWRRPSWWPKHVAVASYPPSLAIRQVVHCLLYCVPGYSSFTTYKACIRRDSCHAQRQNGEDNCSLLLNIPQERTSQSVGSRCDRMSHSPKSDAKKAADSGMVKMAGGKYMDVVAGYYPILRKWVLKE